MKILPLDFCFLHFCYVLFFLSVTQRFGCKSSSVVLICDDVHTRVFMGLIFISLSDYLHCHLFGSPLVWSHISLINKCVRLQPSLLSSKWGSTPAILDREEHKSETVLKVQSWTLILVTRLLLKMCLSYLFTCI